jgi:hypothetical protein
MLAGVPNQPATAVRSFRCPDEEWEALRRIADDLGLDMTGALMLAIRRFIRQWPTTD